MLVLVLVLIPNMVLIWGYTICACDLIYVALWLIGRANHLIVTVCCSTHETKFRLA